MNNTPLPRRDLREPAFRRYEKLLAKACVGSFIHTPERSPATFIARFYDARLAFKRFGYKSYCIPESYPLDRIKVLELPGGRVLVQNLFEDGRKAARESTVYYAKDQAAILELAGKLSRKELEGPFKVFVASDEELAFMFALSDQFDVAARDDHDGTMTII